MKERASFVFENTRGELLVVYVEPWPERFLLKPNEVLEIRYVRPGDAQEIRVQAHEEGITLWADFGDDPQFLIDGTDAETRSWRD